MNTLCPAMSCLIWSATSPTGSALYLGLKSSCVSGPLSGLIAKLRAAPAGVAGHPQAPPRHAAAAWGQGPAGEQEGEQVGCCASGWSADAGHGQLDAEGVAAARAWTRRVPAAATLPRAPHHTRPWTTQGGRSSSDPPAALCLAASSQAFWASRCIVGARSRAGCKGIRCVRYNPAIRPLFVCHVSTVSGLSTRSNTIDLHC